jgi:dihydrofolate synthase/folylpolyglutamate synthase
MVWLPHWPRVGAELQIKLGLERITEFLKALGSPHLKLPPTIHVAGTNGKGSTIAFMRSIAEEAGLKVHRYISPHLIRFNERILLAGQEISDDHLFSLLEECRITSERTGLNVSFFEGVTAAAFLAFSRTPADLLLLEVGLGGRLDATNVIDQPLACVITPISYDHEAFLGSTLSQIAYEKAGIIKPHRPCIVSLQTEEARTVIENHAAQVQATLIQYEYDFGASLTKTGELEYKSTKRTLTTPAPSLSGYHQYINAATAIATLDQCYSFSDDTIRSAITKAHWPGRLTRIESSKYLSSLLKNSELWVDGAHNEAGGQALASWLADQPKMPTFLIFGMTKNRDINKFLRHFKDLLTQIICVNIYSEPLSYKGEQIPALITDPDLKAIAIPATTLDEAFDYITKSASQTQKIRILIAGSLFLASDFFINR